MQTTNLLPRGPYVAFSRPVSCLERGSEIQISAHDTREGTVVHVRHDGLADRFKEAIAGFGSAIRGEGA